MREKYFHLLAYLPLQSQCGRFCETEQFFVILVEIDFGPLIVLNFFTFDQKPPFLEHFLVSLKSRLLNVD